MSEYMEALEEEEFLPDGWTEDSDIFAADEGRPEEAQEEPAEPPTTEQVPETQGEPEPAPTTEQEEAKPEKLRFTARIDHQDRDVELEIGDLPTVWQKAQATDRAQAKLAKLTPTMERGEKLAKAMGYDDLNSFMESAEKNYRDGEVRRLVSDGVHEEVARDMVQRRVSAPAETKAPERDYRAEAKQLADARPDLRGQTIPQEVIRRSVESGRSLLAEYTEYEAGQHRAELDKLRRENEILKQNAASAARAPVTAVTGGGATDTKPKDDFLSGFDDD